MGVRKTNCRGRLTRSGTIAGSLPQLANMLTIQELQTWKRNTRINIVPDKKLAYLFGEPLAKKNSRSQEVENSRRFDFPTSLILGFLNSITHGHLRSVAQRLVDNAIPLRQFQESRSLVRGGIGIQHDVKPDLFEAYRNIF